MTEVRFFEPGTVPEHTTRSWYATRERAPHLEQDAHRPRLLKAYEFVLDAIARLPGCTISDMGCGDGGLLSLLKADGFTGCWGYDLSKTNVDAAVTERGVAVALADFATDPALHWGEVAVLTETLEHLTDPHALLRHCLSDIVIASSPNGETAECHYSYHCWGWSMDGYRAMFEAAGYEVVRHELVGGFQILMGVRP